MTLKWALWVGEEEKKVVIRLSTWVNNDILYLFLSRAQKFTAVLQKQPNWALKFGTNSCNGTFNFTKLHKMWDMPIRHFKLKIFEPVFMSSQYIELVKTNSYGMDNLAVALATKKVTCPGNFLKKPYPKHSNCMCIQLNNFKMENAIF